MRGCSVQRQLRVMTLMSLGNTTGQLTTSCGAQGGPSVGTRPFQGGATGRWGSQGGILEEVGLGWG
jgi:hypothetical protein